MLRSLKMICIIPAVIFVIILCVYLFVLQYQKPKKNPKML